MNSYSTRMEIRAQREPYFLDKIAVTLAHITNVDGSRKVAIVEPLTLRTIEEHDNCVSCEPTFRLWPDEAQQFMDELWRTGIRPTEGAGSVGQLGAVQEHLADMRALVFKLDPSTMKKKQPIL